MSNSKKPTAKNTKAKSGKKPKMPPINIWPNSAAKAQAAEPSAPAETPAEKAPKEKKIDKAAAKAEWAQVVQETKAETPTPETPAEKAPKAKTAAPAKEKKMSGLAAAAKVLAESGAPMNVKDVIETAAAKGYWSSDAKTPHATIYAAIIREISKKGAEARFKKTDRGLFTVA